MSNAYRLVVFDWEGTLGDTLGQFLNAIVVAAKQQQLGDVDLKLARRMIVLGPVVALRKLFPELSVHAQSDLLQTAQHIMLTHTDGVCLMQGALDLLIKLKQAGFFLAIATNKGQQSLARDLEAAGVSTLFDVTRSASQAPMKPCPQMLEEIMAVLGVSPTETVMIGDSVSDMEMASQVNVSAIGVDFYHQNESSLRAAGAYKVFDNFQQLAEALF